MLVDFTMAENDTTLVMIDFAEQTALARSIGNEDAQLSRHHTSRDPYSTFANLANSTASQMGGIKVTSNYHQSVSSSIRDKGAADLIDFD